VHLWKTCAKLSGFGILNSLQSTRDGVMQSYHWTRSHRAQGDGYVDVYDWRVLIVHN
jgi:hypothetical protein